VNWTDYIALVVNLTLRVVVLVTQIMAPLHNRPYTKRDSRLSSGKMWYDELRTNITILMVYLA
jgi:hypothetical protein